MQGLIVNRFDLPKRIDGVPLLNFAFRCSNIELIDALFIVEINAEDVSMDGRNFVHELCRHGRVDLFSDVIETLTQRNLKHLLTARTVGGQTPLMMAIQSRNCDLVS